MTKSRQGPCDQSDRLRAAAGELTASKLSMTAISSISISGPRLSAFNRPSARVILSASLTLGGRQLPLIRAAEGKPRLLLFSHRFARGMDNEEVRKFRRISIYPAPRYGINEFSSSRQVLPRPSSSLTPPSVLPLMSFLCPSSPFAPFERAFFDERHAPDCRSPVIACNLVKYDATELSAVSLFPAAHRQSERAREEIQRMRETMESRNFYTKLFSTIASNCRSIYDFVADYYYQ
jgi:hypothetical protein